MYILFPACSITVLYRLFEKLIDNASPKHKGNRSHAQEPLYYVIKQRCIFASIFSARTTSMLKVLSQTNWQDRYKMDHFLWSLLSY